MNLFERWSVGLTQSDFLAKYGYGERWRRTAAQVQLTESQLKLLKEFKRRMPILILAGAWCGDCSSQCPIFDRFAEVAPVIEPRYIDRDEHADVQALLRINGGNRVPVVVFFSEDGQEVARYGERTLSRYRQMVAQQTGDGCSTGIVGATDLVFPMVVQEWLNEVERVQWILRLSPRLRQLHRD